MEGVENLLSRKFLFSILITIMGFVLVLVGRVAAERFLNFVAIVGATYIVGNVSSKAVTEYKK